MQAQSLFGCRDWQTSRTPRIPSRLHLPFKLVLRFRVPLSHQLKRSLRAIHFGCNCEYSGKIVDFTSHGASYGSYTKIVWVYAA
jgi:hypothetical protein